MQIDEQRSCWYVVFYIYIHILNVTDCLCKTFPNYTFWASSCNHQKSAFVQTSLYHRPLCKRNWNMCPCPLLLRVSIDQVTHSECQWLLVRDLNHGWGVFASAGFRIFQIHRKCNIPWRETCMLFCGVESSSQVNWRCEGSYCFDALGWDIMCDRC